MYTWTLVPAIFTILTLGLYQTLSINVSRLRYKHNVKAPKTVGDENFENGYRTHLNFAENLIIFLPVLWLTGLFLGSNAAAAFAIIWLIGKIFFSLSYLGIINVKNLGLITNSLATATSLFYMIWILVECSRLMF